MYSGHVKGEFDKTCSYCGAVFHVVVPGLAGHEESEEYLCPECGDVNWTRASNTPSTTLISPRTDGRTTKSPSLQARIDELDAEIKGSK